MSKRKIIIIVSAVIIFVMLAAVALLSSGQNQGDPQSNNGSNQNNGSSNETPNTDPAEVSCKSPVDVLYYQADKGNFYFTEAGKPYFSILQEDKIGSGRYIGVIHKNTAHTRAVLVIDTQKKSGDDCIVYGPKDDFRVSDAKGLPRVVRQYIEYKLESSF